jgi:hypothetical protein
MMLKSMLLIVTGGLTLFLSSCARRSYPGENPNPNNDPRDNRGVYGNYPQNLPPGQAKKVYGDQSARRHAPGQRKKQQGYRPPAVIIISDQYARQDRYGQWYYDDADNYRYWRKNDGRYYLDPKYTFDDNCENKQYRDDKDDDRYKERKEHKQKHHRKGNGNRQGDDD